MGYKIVKAWDLKDGDVFVTLFNAVHMALHRLNNGEIEYKRGKKWEKHCECSSLTLHAEYLLVSDKWQEMSQNHKESVLKHIENQTWSKK